jgi:hypothetical protein
VGGFRQRSVVLMAGTEPETATVALVSHELLGVLRGVPALGRGLAVEDTLAPQAGVALISHEHGSVGSAASRVSSVGR